MNFLLIKTGLLVSSLFCYLEWGNDNSAFLFQVEYLIFTRNASAESFMHPLVITPFIGQLLILISLFITGPSPGLTLTGIVMLSILILLVLFVGILSTNLAIIASTMPFIIISVVYIIAWKRLRLSK